MNRIASLMDNFPFRLILGSASPRRRQLLESMGFNFTVSKLDIDEDSWPPTLQGPDIALFLASKKATGYSGTLEENELLITADTIVWCEGKIFNKPANEQEAIQMLHALSGKMHEVFTAVCLRGSTTTKCFYDSTRVYFKKFPSEEIEYYVSKCKPFDKAGSYGVQEWLGYTGIEKIEGSFYNVMGLPVKLLYEELMNLC